VSTFRTLTLVVATAALVCASIATSIQAGKGPVSVDGPNTVNPGSTGNSYMVTVDDVSKSTARLPGDTYVDILCDNSAFHPSVTRLRIPAGATYGWFTVSVDSNATGSCQVQASNTNGAASKVTYVN
jgi:hypothetical protein